MTDIDHTAEKKASYRNRVRSGQRVILARPVSFARFQGWDAPEAYTDRGELPAGTAVTVYAESNAGFDGIQAYLTADDGRTANVSTGALRRPISTRR